MLPNNPSISIEDINRLFPDTLIKTLKSSNPDAEANLKKHISDFINQQKNIQDKLQVLMKSATIDEFNENINYWIIKTAFELVPASKRKSMFHEFLHELVKYIPQSTFLWFYLQHTACSLGKHAWKLLFKTYPPENINQAMKH